MKSRGRAILVVLLTTAIMVALLAWSFHGVDFGKAIEAFRNARWGLFPVAILIQLAVFPVKAYRWRVILGERHRVPLFSLLAAIMIGFMANSIFSRLGELVRAAVLGARRQTATATAFASIALERVFDVLIVLLFLGAALVWLDPAADGETGRGLAQVRVAGLTVGALFVVVTVFLVLLRLRPAGTTRFVLFFAGWLPSRVRPHIQRFLHTFLEGLNALKSVRQVVWVLILSLAHWGIQVLYFYTIGACFPDLPLVIPGAMLVFAVSALGVGAIPTPGYIGIYQSAIIVAAGIIGMPDHLNEVVFNYAWLSWAGSIPPIILAGFAFLWIEGLKMSQLRAEAAEAEEELA